MKQLLIILLFTIILAGCTAQGDINIQDINETALNELYNQYKNDKDVDKFIKKNNIDVTKLQKNTQPQKIPETKPSSCFSKKSKKQQKCLDKQGNEVLVDENKIMLQQRNLRTGMTVLFDELNWNTQQSQIKKVEVKTLSKDYDIYLVEDMGAGKQIKLGKNLDGSKSFSLNKKYNSKDKKVHILIIDNNDDPYHPNSFEIYLEGEKQ